MSIDLDDLARDAVSGAPTTTPDLGALRDRVRRRRRKRRIVASALAAPVILLASFGVWLLADREGSSTQIVAAGRGEEPGPTAGPAAAAPGGFVWPAPPRDFVGLDALTRGLIDEVLGWSPDRVRRDGGGDDNAPQSFTLVNLDTNRELVLLAVPSAQGWGFVRIGDPGTTIGETEGGFAIMFQAPAGTDYSIVEIRYLDGTVTSETTTRSEIPLPSDRAPQTVASVLITHADAAGAIITASGGQFNRSDGFPTAPTEDAVVPVPNLVGLDVDESTEILNAAGLRVAIIEAPSTDTPTGVVISIEPAPGSQVATGTMVTVTVTAAPSQSEADAARDEIVPAVAALPFDVRVRQVDELVGPTRVDTDEGTWIISQPVIDSADLTDGCTLGDPNGVYGLDRVCVNEYAELLLLAHGTGKIIRAYPFPGLKPQRLQATSDALYCIRQGDGGLPDSMLCRIDLATLDATVRVFPSALDSGYSPGPDRWTPSTWIIDEPTGLALWENLDATVSGITISGWSGTATIDPDTLALLAVDESASG